MMLDTARPGMPRREVDPGRGIRAVLVELSVMEQRYHAVMEVVSGAPVTEVARRNGVSRQPVHGWLGRYERDGPPPAAPQLEDQSQYPAGTIVPSRGTFGLCHRLNGALYRLGVDGGPAVSETGVTVSLSRAARGTLNETRSRCDAVLAQTRESVLRAQEALAVAQENLRRAREAQEEAQERVQERYWHPQQGTIRMSSAGG